MSLRSRLTETFKLIHQVEARVLEGTLPTGKVNDSLELLLKGDPVPRWIKEKRYKPWVLVPVFEESLFLPRDEAVEGTVWDKKDEWFPEELTAPQIEVGANILWRLDTLGWIERSPCLEDLQYYLTHELQRKDKWDRTEHAVFAWRDAVVSRLPQHNILVPGLVYINEKLQIKWVTLQEIARYKSKILIRRN